MSAAGTTSAAAPARASALPLGTPAAYAAELLGTFVIVLGPQERTEQRPIHAELTPADTGYRPGACRAAGSRSRAT